MKLTRADIDEIRRLRKGGMPAAELALRLNIHISTIYAVTRGEATGKPFQNPVDFESMWRRLAEKL